MLGAIVFTAGSSALAVQIPVVLEDWGDVLNEWDERFVERHAIYHVENLESGNYDAATIQDPPSVQYLHFSNISWTWKMDGLINGVRAHEDAFLHYAEPAGLVAFQGTDHRVELRWRLDYRSFVHGDSITVRNTGNEIRDYRILRGTSPGSYTQVFMPGSMTGDEGTFTDTSTVYGGTSFYKVESILSGSPISYSDEVAVDVVAGSSTGIRTTCWRIRWIA